MLRTTFASSRALRVCALGLVTITTAILISSESADARRYKHRRHPRRPRKLQPAVFLDHRRRQFRRGAHLEQSRRVRRPASLTKIMTLYLLFERSSPAR